MAGNTCYSAGCPRVVPIPVPCIILRPDIAMDALRTLFDSELGYVVLLFGLFVVPRVLLRWRIPTAVTSFGLGTAAAIGFDLFDHNETLHLLASFGIVALFLFAGLEVDLLALRRHAVILGQHLAIRVGLIALVAFIATHAFSLDPRPGILFAIAILIPSTGFILDSLPSFGLDADEQFWVKGKAIATEILALVLLSSCCSPLAWPASAWRHSRSVASSRSCRRSSASLRCGSPPGPRSRSSPSC